MKLLFGTGNQAKLSVMRSRLEKLGIELIGLNDLRAEGKTIPEILENGDTPLENARLKALAYYEAFQMPVFSCDSGLYFDNVPQEIQPGVHVRTVGGKSLSDEEMREYYGGLARKNGNLVAQYRNAICFVMDENHVYEAMEPSMYSEKFILTEKPHSAIRKNGFPLDSMSIDMKTNKYYYDLTADELEQFAVEDGVLKFFEKHLSSSNETAEIWDLYSENRELLGRDHIRGEQLPIDGYHLVVHVWICNSKGEYLISQRSATRPTLPLRWECVGGSVVKGENSLQGAIREAKEEVGVNLQPENGQVLFTKVRKEIYGRRVNDIVDVWQFKYDGEIDLSNATTDEVEQVKWMNRDQIRELFDKGVFVDSLEYFFTEVDTKRQGK